MAMEMEELITGWWWGESGRWVEALAMGLREATREGVGTIGLHTSLPDAGTELGEVGSHQVLRR